ncbi:helix-turn-helix transcriptional regulator [Streptomyces sp. NPDC013178]|uniref:helix-turn-helix domain-containing protein n=1 Tax=Streptomyces sp. NPDC013178 TaxID=3155118 RepID=UPI0033F50AC2
MDGNRLGTYLRARRALVRPADVGLVGSGRRRVPGLRREEVALLAGISAEYYLRLEQGRDRNPSSAVLDSLARVLLLDADATAYLHGLVSAPPRRTGKAGPQTIAAGIRWLISADWASTPVMVTNRCLDILASNALAEAVCPVWVEGRNTIRDAFLDPALRSLYENWEEMAQRSVAGLRALVGPAGEDRRVVELVHELSTSSEEFRRLWARHDVSPKGSGTSWIRHPVVGRMELVYQRLVLPGTDGQMLVVHHAEPGSASAEALARLLVQIGAGSRSGAAG